MNQTAHRCRAAPPTPPRPRRGRGFARSQLYPRRDAPLYRYLVWNCNISQQVTRQYEKCELALGIIAVESSLPATSPYQRKHRVDRWCCDLDEAAEFLDGGDECIDL